MSIQCNMQEPLWVERYRPQTIADCILPKKLKKQFEDIVKSGRIPNLLLTGTAGTGKTTVAKALCNELNVDWIIINASEDNGIDLIRNKIRDFASTVSFSDSGKCVILDEADALTPAAQSALRGGLESFSQTCSFVFTCNYPSKIIDPLHSRTVRVDYEIPKAEQPAIQAAFFKRVCSILENEKIKFDQMAVATLIQKFFPDNRRILGQLQQYGRGGEIDAGILNDLQEVSIDGLIKSMKSKKFAEVRQWCAENSNNDLGTLYTKLYKALKDTVEPASIPEAILILEDSQRYHTTVPDLELHVAAMCVSLMSSVSFK
ncbi:replication factor C small subunit [compost metagenome]